MFLSLLVSLKEMELDQDSPVSQPISLEYKPLPNTYFIEKASPQGSDQTVKPRPRGPQLEPYCSPPYPSPSNQPTLNRPTRLPTLCRSPWGNPCVGVPSKGSFEHSVTPTIRAGRPFPPSPAVAPQPVASSYQRVQGGMLASCTPETTF